ICIIDSMKEEFDKRRRYMYEHISKMPYVSTLEPKGAFYIFVDMSETLEKEYKGEKIGTTARLAEILLEDYFVAVVPCNDFGFPEHIRLSYAISMEQIEKGLDRMETFLKTL
ncbi:MAG: aminotransferase class I/II-fold pyridoxal phosphate-dependent enzyme, partial [Lachnospiraceae bacterium]|nr:aminotransferase class I/II-fold pyridoxal phosphate-dependent enzyme [Lachnospiraceae bacterium]